MTSRRLAICWGLVLFAFVGSQIFAEEIAAPAVVLDTSLQEHVAGVKQIDSGVKQIDVVNPQHGLSHNRFVDYGVGEKGVVINNSRYSGNLEGAGHLEANPNLKESAKTVLFEVTGTRRSDLRGPTVIAGDQAKFILVNPNGISCDGGSFINTHDVELRAERLLASGATGLSYGDSGGEVIVGQRGLTAPGGSLLLSGNKIKIRGGVTAKELLKLEASYSKSSEAGESETVDSNGSNEENKQTKKEEIIHAIDVNTVAPIEAGKIYLIATGAGTGVKVAAPQAIVGLLARDEDVLIGSNSRVDIAGNIHAKGELEVLTKDLAIVDSELLGAKGLNILSKDQLYLNENKLQSNGDLSLTAKKLEEHLNYYEIGGWIKIDVEEDGFSNQSRFSSNGKAEVLAKSYKSKLSSFLSKDNLEFYTQRLEIQGGELLVEKLIKINTSELTTKRYVGDALANSLRSKEVEIKAAQNFSNDGFAVLGDEKLSIETSELTNGSQGELKAGKKLAIESDQVKNLGHILSGDGIEISGRLINEGNLFGIKIDIYGSNLENRGYIYGNRLEIEVDSDVKQEDGRIIADVIKLTAGDKIGIAKKGLLHANYGLEITSHDVEVLGELGSTRLELNIADNFTNRGKLAFRDLLLFTGTKFNNYGDIITFNWDPEAKLDGARMFSIQVKGLFSNAGKLMIGGNDQGAQDSGSTFSLLATHLDFTSGGALDTSHPLHIVTDRLSMADGSQIRGEQDVLVESGELLGKGALIASGDMTVLTEGNLSNGIINAKGKILLRAKKDLNVGVIKGIGEIAQDVTAMSGGRLEIAELDEVNRLEVYGGKIRKLGLRKAEEAKIVEIDFTEQGDLQQEDKLEIYPNCRHLEIRYGLKGSWRTGGRPTKCQAGERSLRYQDFTAGTDDDVFLCDRPALEGEGECYVGYMACGCHYHENWHNDYENIWGQGVVPKNARGYLRIEKVYNGLMDGTIINDNTGEIVAKGPFSENQRIQLPISETRDQVFRFETKGKFKKHFSLHDYHYKDCLGVAAFYVERIYREQRAILGFEDHPIEVKGDLILGVDRFVNNRLLKVGGNAFFELPAGFANGAGGELNIGGNLHLNLGNSSFTNHGKAWVEGGLRVKGDYAVNHGSLDVDRAIFHLLGKDPKGRAFDMGEGGVLNIRGVNSYEAEKEAQQKGGEEKNAEISARSEGTPSSVPDTLVIIAPEAGVYIGHKKILTGTGVYKDGFVLQSSQILNPNGKTYIQSGDNIHFHGAKGRFHTLYLDALQGGVVKEQVEGKYLKGHKQEITGYKRYCNIRGPLGCLDHRTITVYEDIPVYEHPRLEVDIEINPGGQIIQAKDDIIYKGVNELVAGDSRLTSSKGKVRLEALKVYNDLGGAGQGDKLAVGVVSDEQSLDEELTRRLESESKSGDEFTPSITSSSKHDSHNYKGTNMLVGGKLVMQAQKDVVLEAPVLLSRGGISIESREGGILGTAMLGHYLDRLSPDSTYYAIAGTAGVIATLNEILLLAPGGAIKIKGVKLTADTIDIIAKEIELSGIHDTVTQYRYSRESNWCSESVRETWESHIMVIMTEIEAKRVNLVTSDGNVTLSGANIRTEEGKINVEAKNIHLDPYVIPHWVKTVEGRSGFSFGGLFGVATVAPHESLNNVIVNKIPAINAIDNLGKVRSKTDFAPMVQFGVEALRVLSSKSVGDAVTEQLGITMYDGIPLPSGGTFYKQTISNEVNYQESIPTVLNASSGEVNLNATGWLSVKGSAVLAKDGKIHIEAKKFEYIPAELDYKKESRTDQRSIGISSSPASLGVQYGRTVGKSITEGRQYSHGSVVAKELELDVEGDVRVGSVILAETVTGRVGGDLLVESYQEALTSRSNYKSWSYGATLDLAGGGVIPRPNGSYHRSMGDGVRRWAEVPAIIKGKEVYLDVGGTCTLVGGGILVGENVTLIVDKLEWRNVHNEDRQKEKSYGFDSGALGNLAGSFGNGLLKKDWNLDNGLKQIGELAGRGGDLVKGWLSFFGQSRSDQEGVVRATISEGAKIELRGEGVDGKSREQERDAILQSLNRDEEKMVEVGTKKEEVLTVAVPVIDFGELKRRWDAKSTLLQKAIVDTNQSTPASLSADVKSPEQAYAEAELEMLKEVAAEAIEQGFFPEDVADVMQGLADEHYVAKNLEKLNEYRGGKEIAVEEVIDVLEGKEPVKDQKGEVSFKDVPKKFSGGKVTDGDKEEKGFWDNYKKSLENMYDHDMAQLHDVINAWRKDVHDIQQPSFIGRCRLCFKYGLLSDPVFLTAAGLTALATPIPKVITNIPLKVPDGVSPFTGAYSIMGHKLSNSGSVPDTIKSMLETKRSLVIGNKRTTNIPRYAGRLALPVTATFTGVYSASRMFRCITEKWDKPGN